MAVVSIWVCDVCGSTIKSEEVLELRAYGRLYIHVCGDCIGKKVLKVAKGKKKWQDSN